MCPEFNAALHPRVIDNKLGMRGPCFTPQKDGTHRMHLWDVDLAVVFYDKKTDAPIAYFAVDYQGERFHPDKTNEKQCEAFKKLNKGKTAEDQEKNDAHKAAIFKSLGRNVVICGEEFSVKRHKFIQVWEKHFRSSGWLNTKNPENAWCGRDKNENHRAPFERSLKAFAASLKK